MHDERLKHFDGSLEGAAEYTKPREDGIDWHQVQENIVSLETQLEQTERVIAEYRNHAQYFEEQLLKHAEGNPEREAVLKQWESLKGVVTSLERDQAETKQIVQTLLNIPLTQEGDFPPPKTLQ